MVKTKLVEKERRKHMKKIIAKEKHTRKKFERGYSVSVNSQTLSGVRFLEVELPRNRVRTISRHDEERKQLLSIFVD